MGGLGSGGGVRGLGSAELWLGSEELRGLGSGVLRSVKLGPGELGLGG